MTEGMIAVAVLVMIVAVGFVLSRPAPGDDGVFTESDLPHEVPVVVPEDGPYPNGSVPYGDGEESLALRAKRFACAALNHHPRSYTGSWCMGYGYVCGRCYMYADPVPTRQLEQMCDALNRLPPDEQQMAAASMSGGGPNPRRF